jgi:hypothetical protein
VVKAIAVAHDDDALHPLSLSLSLSLSLCVIRMADGVEAQPRRRQQRIDWLRLSCT